MPAFPQLSAAQVAAVSIYVATQIADPAARTAHRRRGRRAVSPVLLGLPQLGRARRRPDPGPQRALACADYPAAEALAAMIYGRGNMPVFAGTTFDVRQQAAVALYVEVLQAPPSPGGWGLGYIGPVPEGLAAFLALCLLLLVTVWLAWGKGQDQARDRTRARQRAARPAGRRASPCSSRSPAACGFVAFFVVGNNAQELGGTMALAFLGLGFALAYWGRDLTPDDVEVGTLPPAAAQRRLAGRTGARRDRPRSATSSPAAPRCSPGGGS